MQLLSGPGKKGNSFWGTPLLLGQPPNKKTREKGCHGTTEKRCRTEAAVGPCPRLDHAGGPSKLWLDHSRRGEERERQGEERERERENSWIILP